MVFCACLSFCSLQIYFTVFLVVVVDVLDVPPRFCTICVMKFFNLLSFPNDDLNCSSSFSKAEVVVFPSGFDVFIDMYSSSYYLLDTSLLTGVGIGISPAIFTLNSNAGANGILYDPRSFEQISSQGLIISFATRPHNSLLSLIEWMILSFVVCILEQILMILIRCPKKGLLFNTSNFSPTIPDTVLLMIFISQNRQSLCYQQYDFSETKMWRKARQMRVWAMLHSQCLKSIQRRDQKNLVRLMVDMRMEEEREMEWQRTSRILKRWGFSLVALVNIERRRQNRLERAWRRGYLSRISMFFLLSSLFPFSSELKELKEQQLMMETRTFSMGELMNGLLDCPRSNINSMFSFSSITSSRIFPSAIRQYFSITSINTLERLESVSPWVSYLIFEKIILMASVFMPLASQLVLSTLVLSRLRIIWRLLVMLELQVWLRSFLKTWGREYMCSTNYLNFRLRRTRFTRQKYPAQRSRSWGCSSCWQRQSRQVLDPGVFGESLKKLLARQTASVSNISAESMGYLYFLSCESDSLGGTMIYYTACLMRSVVWERYSNRCELKALSSAMKSGQSRRAEREGRVTRSLSRGLARCCPVYQEVMGLGIKFYK